MNMLLVEAARDNAGEIQTVELDQEGMGHEASTPDALLLTRRLAMIDRSVEVCRYAPEPAKVPDAHITAMDGRVARLELAKGKLLEQLHRAVTRRLDIEPEPIAA